EADIADLAGLAGGDGGLNGAAGGEDAVGILVADDLVELDQIDGVSAQTAHRLLELAVELLLGAAVHLGHQEDLVAIAVAQGLAHADLAGALVVVPAVVHEGDAAIDGLADEGDAGRGVERLLADVVAAQADGGDG